MSYLVGDIVQMKKAHPCGVNEWEILQVNKHFKMYCGSSE